MNFDNKEFQEKINNIIIKWFTDVLGEIFEEKNLEKAIDLSYKTINAFLEELNYLNNLVNQFELNEKKISSFYLLKENQSTAEVNACLGLLRELKGGLIHV